MTAVDVCQCSPISIALDIAVELELAWLLWLLFLRGGILFAGAHHVFVGLVFEGVEEGEALVLVKFERLDRSIRIIRYLSILIIIRISEKVIPQ